MVFDLIPQGDLVQLAADAKAAQTVYSIGKQLYDRLTGFVGVEQQKNAAKLSENTETKLKDISRDRLSRPSPSVVTPLLEAAVQESREELQDLWAALLANAMIDGGRKVRKEFVGALAEMEPIDALVLQKIAALPFPGDLGGGLQPNLQYILNVQNEGIGPDTWMVSCRTLSRLGFINEHVAGTLYPLPELTPFGKLLLEACRVA